MASGVEASAPVPAKRTRDDILKLDLDNPDPSSFKTPHIRFQLLKINNYRIWASTHERFLRSRGLWGIVSGSVPEPSLEDEIRARNWLIADQWIATLLVSHVESSQQTHIADVESSKDIWAALKRVHGLSGKGRLVPMLQNFYGYVKRYDESVDQMCAALAELRVTIGDITPGALPSDISTAAVIMNACQGKEYDMAKFTLGQLDDLTPARAVEALRTVEQDVLQAEGVSRAEGALAAKGVNQNGQGTGRQKDKSHVQCWQCGKHGHYADKCPGSPASSRHESPTSSRHGSSTASSSSPGSSPRSKDLARVAYGGWVPPRKSYRK